MKENQINQGKERMVRLIVVTATWDPEASVWVAESPDLPLVTEAPTIEALKAKLPGIIQDLLEDDDNGQDDLDVPIEFVARYSERVRIRAPRRERLF